MVLDNFALGIRPSQKMFRITSIAGLITDAVLNLRGSKLFGDLYYSKVASNYEEGVFELFNKDLGNSLKLTSSEVTFLKTASDRVFIIDKKKAITEFEEVFKTLNKTLMMNNIRRIGILARFILKLDSKTIPTAKLLESLTNFPKTQHQHKLNLRYEVRRPTLAGVVPDVNESDFVNVIYSYQDSELLDREDIENS
ncbi:MAG: hypothetical protein OEZ58_07350, partial [Gammaproteobacteria bacterium]|nr:hypothetical protein [Gammaproteobacteria bacterium]